MITNPAVGDHSIQCQHFTMLYIYSSSFDLVCGTLGPQFCVFPACSVFLKEMFEAYFSPQALCLSFFVHCQSEFEFLTGKKGFQALSGSASSLPLNLSPLLSCCHPAFRAAAISSPMMAVAVCTPGFPSLGILYFLLCLSASPSSDPSSILPSA